MATTICVRLATRTSANVRTSLGVGATIQNAVYTVPGRTVVVPYTTTACLTRSGTRVCGVIPTSRLSISPAHLLTTPITIHVQRTSYITSYVTLYSTSCTVSRRTTPIPTTTPPPRPVTTYVTVGTTTTRTSTFTPSQSTVDATSSDGGIVDPSDTPVTVDGGVTTGPKKVPIGAIVGGVLGGLVAAALIGFIVYQLVFKKAIRRRSQESSREHLEHQRPLSTGDGHSSPSEGSSGVLQPQMQEYDPRYSNIYSGQGHQYTHVRQDSQTMAMPVPLPGMEQFSSPGLGEQGNYYRDPRSQYVGHAEIQDSRF